MKRHNRSCYLHWKLAEGGKYDHSCFHPLMDEFYKYADEVDEKLQLEATIIKIRKALIQHALRTRVRHQEFADWPSFIRHVKALWQSHPGWFDLDQPAGVKLTIMSDPTRIEEISGGGYLGNPSLIITLPSEDLEEVLDKVMDDDWLEPQHVKI